MQQASFVRRVGVTSCISFVVGLIVLMAAYDGTNATSGEESPLQAAAGVVFLRNPAQTAELWLADAQGQNQRQLMEQVTSYSPSPDGTKIAYAIQPPDAPSKVAVFDTASGESTILGWDLDYGSYNPSWSPAGGPGIIAYERRSFLQEGLGAPKLWLAQADGSDLGPVMRGGDVITYEGVWSPDGTRLGFIDPLRDEIGIFNFSDQLRRIPLAGEFSWSPDGSKIIVSALPLDQPGQTHLEIYDLSDDSRKAVFAESAASDYAPRWSPTGDMIAFVRRTQTNPRGAIWIGSLKDGTVRQITDTSVDLVDDSDPQWSPDGSQLLWSRLPLGAAADPAALWIVDINTLDAPRVFIENATRGRWFK